jgi:PIN domain nuclease of toxin-antitoxin system
LRAEPGADRVAAALTDGTQSLIHAVNLVEVRYYLLRRGQADLRVGDQQIGAAGIEVVRSLDEDLLAVAVQLKAQYPPIALGDVFGVALAAQRNATFLTTDRGELEKVTAAGVCRIEFLR